MTGSAPGLWRITVDGTRCQGSGVCAGLAPEYFQLGADDKSHPIVTLASQNLQPVAECCPAEAISVTPEQVR